MATIFATAFIYELSFDGLSDRMWDSVNKGVSCLNAASIKASPVSDIPNDACLFLL
ncbi:Cytochrome b-c1 complex subunit 9 [Batrachochytrium dendrobatidis]